VLGSGGPVASRRRVSAGYVLSIDEKPRLLVDAGGGSFERIGQSGLDISSLEQILLTHLHIDHTSDLPAVIMDLYMGDRKETDRHNGPTGRPVMTRPLKTLRVSRGRASSFACCSDPAGPGAI